MERPGYMIIIFNNKSYYIYNHLDSNELFHYTAKFLNSLLLTYTPDEIVTIISEIEFIDAKMSKFHGYCEEECGSDKNTFGYVLDDDDRSWNNHHLSLFKLFRDKKVYYNSVIDGAACPYKEPHIIAINFDDKTISCSEIYPIKISLYMLETLL
jgi:hypothetical protein